MDKTLFVLGAGASYDLASTPLGDELGWDYHPQTVEASMLVNGSPQATPDQARRNQEYITFLEVAQEICPELGKLSDSFHKSQGSIYIWNRPDYLPKKCYLDDMLRVVQDKGDLSKASILKRIIYKHIIGAGFGIGNDGYESFINKVADKKYQGENTSIISLNFDTYVREGYFLNNRFVSFSYGIDFDFIESNRRDWYIRHGTPIIPLVKLNGSFDWTLCRKCEKLSLLHWHRKEEDYENLKCLNPKCRSSVEPLVCMPYDQPDKRLTVLQDLAAQEIKKADQIIVIGYSFPDYDSHIIKLFNKNTNPNASVLVVDITRDESDSGRKERNSKIEEKCYRIFPLLSKTNLNIRLDGFRSFLRDFNET